MLFVAPDFWGMGIGKELVLMAFRNFNIRYVDVNEQNPQAEGFYRHWASEPSNVRKPTDKAILSLS